MRRRVILEISVTARWAVCKLMTARGSSIDPSMPERLSAETALITAIEANARQYFPEASIIVRPGDPEGSWVLLVNDDGLTHCHIATTLGELLRKSERLFDYTDAQNE